MHFLGPAGSHLAISVWPNIPGMQPGSRAPNPLDSILVRCKAERCHLRLEMEFSCLHKLRNASKRNGQDFSDMGEHAPVQPEKPMASWAGCKPTYAGQLRLLLWGPSWLWTCPRRHLNALPRSSRFAFSNCGLAKFPGNATWFPGTEPT